MRLKKGVRIAGLRPEMVLGLMMADKVFHTYGYEMVITSAVDSKHGNGSLHFSGAAVDLRTRDLSGTHTGVIINELKYNLGVDYDVVLESDHIHLEFQPHTGMNI